MKNHGPSSGVILSIIKSRAKERKAFIVADFETVMIDKQHVPDAAGLSLVRPGEKISNMLIDVYYSEEYRFLSSFQDRSKA